MNPVFIDDLKIVECNSETIDEDCNFSDFEMERTAYSFDDDVTFYNKIRKAFERHMICIIKKNTTGVTKVKVKNIGISQKRGMYKYNIKGTRYALAVLSIDCNDFISFDKKVEKSVSIIKDNYKDSMYYRIISRVPLDEYRDAYKEYCNSNYILSILEKGEIPPSAAWVQIKAPADVDNRYLPFVIEGDSYQFLLFISGTICGLGIMYMFTNNDKYTFSGGDYLAIYDRMLTHAKYTKNPYHPSFFDE